MQEADIAHLCDTCTGLHLTRADFENPPFEPDGKYKSVVAEGTLSGLRQGSIDCGLCRLILYALMRNEHPTRTIDQLDGKARWQAIWKQSTMEYDPNGDCKEDYYSSALYPRLSDMPDSSANYAIQLIDEPDTDAFLRARTLPASVDLELVKSWLDRCICEHGANCAEPPFGIPEYPGVEYGGLFVVDVRHECVVPLPPAERYVTLSYVWGTCAWSRMDQSHFDRFKTPGTVKKDLLPRTVADAITVVDALGFRYLWVDFLCIHQDPEIKRRAIQDMDAIFYHAYLCIIAASGGDAESGLSGWSLASRREGTTLVSQVLSDLRLGVLPFLDGELIYCEHARRAWTFQECVLSTRRLVFMNGFVHFACRSAIWREDMHAELGDLVVSAEGADVFGQQVNPVPLHRLGQYLSAYADRNLTFSSDVLDAFAGIQRALSQPLNGTKFWFGMPASAFDWALLWSGGRRETLSRRSGFPSWSWTGWKGYITMANDHYSEFDQEWLQTRTWIDWNIWVGPDGFVPVWDPVRDGTTKSRMFRDARSSSDGHGSAEPTECVNEEIPRSSNDDNVSMDSDNESGIESCNECPQYGWPVSDNQYGRTQSDHGLPVRGPPRSPLTSSSMIRGTLRFSTVSAAFELDTQTSKQTGYTPYFELKDEQHQFCGIIWNDGVFLEHEFTSGGSVQVLVLSQAALGTTLPFRRLEGTPHYPAEAAPEHDYEEQYILGERHEWNMYNIMLVVNVTHAEAEVVEPVSPARAVYERRGVGLLYRSALGRALAPGPVWEDVHLS